MANKTFFQSRKTSALFSSTLVMMHDDTSKMPMSPQGDPLLSCRLVGVRVMQGVHAVFLVHGGCPPASITQKRPNHGQVSVQGEPKFIEGQQPYVQ